MARSSAGKWLLALVVIGAATAGGYMMWSRGSGQGAYAQMGGMGEMPPLPVPYMEIAYKPVQIWKEFSGRLTAVDYVEIRPQVSGIITKIHFTDGQMVEKGDLLISIDPKPYEAAVAQARADLAAAREDQTYAKKELDRAKELLETGAISQQGYDQRVNAAEVNSSAIAAANARLKAAQVDLDRAEIKAPVAGRISRAEVTEGNLVTAEAAPLLTSIVSREGIYADFEVDEQTYLTFVRSQTNGPSSEQSIPVRLKLNTDETVYEGQIKSFDNRIDPSSGTIRARALFANTDAALLPGMFVRVQIGAAEQRDVITVPEKAVLTDQNRKFVYVVANDQATYREVQLGQSLNGERIINSGLEPGDRVITDNLMKIRPGAPVQAMTAAELEAMKAQMAGGGDDGMGTAPSPPAPAENVAPETVTPEENQAQPIPFEEPQNERNASESMDEQPEIPAGEADITIPAPAQE